MRIGIIGSGHIGSALTRRFAAAGHDVAVANTRGPDSLRALVAEAGGSARAATREEAVDAGEVVVVAIPLKAWPDLVDDLGADAFVGKVVVDTANYYPQRDGRIAALDADEVAATEQVAQRLPGARVVKAFNTIYAGSLADDSRADVPLAERLAIPLAADDEDAKAIVSDLVAAIGFAPVDGGSLAESRRQQPGTPVYGAQAGPQETARLLAAADV